MKERIKEAINNLDPYAKLDTFDLQRAHREDAQIIYTHILVDELKRQNKFIDWTCPDCILSAKRSILNFVRREVNKEVIEEPKKVVQEVKSIEVDYESMSQKELLTIAKNKGFKAKGNPSKLTLLNYLKNGK